MEFLPYLKIFWERKWIFLVTFLVTMAVTVIGVKMLPATYQAKATVRVLTAIGGDAVWLVRDPVYADRLMNTYASLATSRPVLDRMMAELQLDELPSLKVSFLVNTELLQIVVEDSDPVRAANVANILARLIQEQAWLTNDNVPSQQILTQVLAQIDSELANLRAERQRLIDTNADADAIDSINRQITLTEGSYDSLASQYGALRLRDMLEATTTSIVDDARVPTVPSGPNTRLFLTLGAFVGIVGGLGLSLLFHLMDHRLSSNQKIEQVTGYPLLGKIPYSGNPKPTFFNGKSFESEAFRRLRVNLFAPNTDPQNPSSLVTKVRTLLITSAEPKEGKSTIMASLALSLAQAGINTLIIDTDLRKPTLHKIFELPNNIGLSEVLQGKVSLFDAIQQDTAFGVSVMTSGNLPPAPSELLTKRLTPDLLGLLRKQFDLVLLDTPAFLAVSDASVLIPRVDGVLLVVRRGQAHQPAVEETCRHLEKLHAKVLGVIINNAKIEGEHHYYLHYADEVKN